ncbi:MAG: hypothetical protein AB4041_18505 [Microcystaceae cyanobacterium]
MSNKEYNQQLSKLVGKIKSFQRQSPQKTKLMNQMLYLVQKSGRLSYYRQLIPDYLRDSYQEIYAEAQQNLFYWITQNVDRYDSDRGEVMTWINNKLRYLMLDVISEYKQNTAQNIPIFSLDDLENVSEVKHNTPENQFLSEQVINVIKEDPDGRFKETYPTQKPRANFQFLCLRRYEGYQWQELSDNLKIPVPSLSNFYQRRLKQFAPLIQSYLQE